MYYEDPPVAVPICHTPPGASRVTGVILLAALLLAGPAAQAAPSIRLAVVQFAAGAGTPDQNAERAVRLIRQAAARGARYIVFPEFALFALPRGTRYAVEVPRRAQPVPGPLTTQIQSVARELGVHVAFGMIERRGMQIYNSVVFLNPDGLAGVYAKRHPIKVKLLDQQDGEAEADLYTPGGDPSVVEWGGIRTGVLICADSADERLWAAAGKGTQLIVWPKSSFGYTADQLSARARKLGVPIVAANAALPETRDPDAYGQSRIVSAKGEELARAGTEPDAIVIADVPLAAVAPAEATDRRQ